MKYNPRLNDLYSNSLRGFTEPPSPGVRKRTAQGSLRKFSYEIQE